ncbi:hypothetical protein H7F33_11545 [Pedobacter sp. PAMC26386]|nr:hypothetical protein H7F33_11545 [Pedobacter sp. PAMC26386]
MKISSVLQAYLSQHEEIVKKEEGILEAQLFLVIEKYADQVAYMLQTYHIREKVSRVTVVPDSIVFKSLDFMVLKLQYVLEEFSACSAIDTLHLEKMTVTVGIDEKARELELKGEYWPERDSE